MYRGLPYNLFEKPPMALFIPLPTIANLGQTKAQIIVGNVSKPYKVL
jgi:hypothetical protein